MSKPIEQHIKSGQNGLIISYFGNSVAVEADDGQVFQCYLRRNQALPVVGDKVWWQLEGDNTGIIIDIQPRHTLLTRGDERKKAKPIAANIDVIVIVMAPPPIFSECLVDRYLVAAELLKIQPILVLNKADLLSAAKREAVLNRIKPYQQIPYPVILSSIYIPNGLDELDIQLHSKAGVLVGPSGVGKSSIIARLSQKEKIRIGDISPKGAGKHTTTATRLYHLPHQGKLIDSPGVREFNLWSVTGKEVLQGFKEFQQYLTGCKFRDCLHTVEPDCAVQAAAMSGKISKQRYANYQNLIKESNSSQKPCRLRQDNINGVSKGEKR